MTCRSCDNDATTAALTADGARPLCDVHAALALPAPIRILLIEDEPLLQRATTRTLRAIYPASEISIVDRASTAIGAIATLEPDVIVSDYDLADASTGGDVLAWLREFHPDLARRFVFLSGNERVAQLHDRVLLKPCSRDELGSVVNQLLQEAS